MLCAGCPHHDYCFFLGCALWLSCAVADKEIPADDNTRERTAPSAGTASGAVGTAQDTSKIALGAAA